MKEVYGHCVPMFLSLTKAFSEWQVTVSDTVNSPRKLSGKQALLLFPRTSYFLEAAPSCFNATVTLNWTIKVTRNNEQASELRDWVIQPMAQSTKWINYFLHFNTPDFFIYILKRKMDKGERWIKATLSGCSRKWYCFLCNLGERKMGISGHVQKHINLLLQLRMSTCFLQPCLAKLV